MPLLHRLTNYRWESVHQAFGGEECHADVVLRKQIEEASSNQFDCCASFRSTIHGVDPGVDIQVHSKAIDSIPPIGHDALNYETRALHHRDAISTLGHARMQ